MDNHFKEHAQLNRYHRMTHSKLNRANNDQIIAKSYSFGELFPDLVNDD